MDANELADKLENWRSPDDLKQAATMLRQQADRIAELESICDAQDKNINAFQIEVGRRQAELHSYRQVIFWLMENHPDIWQTILEFRMLESMERKGWIK